MASESLEQAIQRAGNPLEFLRNHNARAHTLPVVPEHTNWQSEQRAWRETVGLMDQSHHMTDLFLSGPDALELLRRVGVNSFEDFGPNKAKQLVVCDYDGFYIGDVIVFHLPDGTFDLVGREIVMDWVTFHAETGEFDVKVERDDNSAVRKSGPPRFYRYEIQGPNAGPLMEKVLGSPLPATKFFSMYDFTIAGRPVHALRHGMAGQPGFELFGPWADGEDVLAAFLEAGPEFGLLRVGGKAYSTANLESGWVPPTLPAVFSGEKTRAFREWLPLDNVGALGGSLELSEISDYYLTPFDLGYGKTVAFDHDFIGREALEKVAANPPRTKVTLVWNVDDVAAIFHSYFDGGEPGKAIVLPKARYAIYQKDAVRSGDRVVGASMDAGYIVNEGAFLSLASVDNEFATPGTEVTVTWGESPVSQKVNVERHRQMEVRATVAPVPFVQFARSTYRDR